MPLFLQGFTIGLAYVAPIGLQNLFVINTALTQKKSRVYLTALIVTFFDVTLALACFFGIGAIMSAFEWLQMIVLGAGSLIVMWIGIGLLRAKDSMDTSTKVDMLLGAFRTTLPKEHVAEFILGVNLSSFVWFFGISTILALFSAKFNDKVLRIINIICGAIIVFYGAKLFINFVQMVV